MRPDRGLLRDSQGKVLAEMKRVGEYLVGQLREQRTPAEAKNPNFVLDMGHGLRHPVKLPRLEHEGSWIRIAY